MITIKHNRDVNFIDSSDNFVGWDGMIWRKKLEESPPNGSVIEVKIDERRSCRFARWLRKNLRHTLRAIRKGSQKA